MAAGAVILSLPFAIGLFLGIALGAAVVWLLVAVEHAREWEAFDRRYKGWR